MGHGILRGGAGRGRRDQDLDAQNGRESFGTYVEEMRRSGPDSELVEEAIAKPTIAYGRKQDHTHRMKSSGKTTAGRLLAKELGARFIDMDAEIERCMPSRRENGCLSGTIFRNAADYSVRGDRGAPGPRRVSGE